MSREDTGVSHRPLESGSRVYDSLLPVSGISAGASTHNIFDCRMLTRLRYPTDTHRAKAQAQGLAKWAARHDAALALLVGQALMALRLW